MLQNEMSDRYNINVKHIMLSTGFYFNSKDTDLYCTYENIVTKRKALVLSSSTKL